MTLVMNAKLIDKYVDVTVDVGNVKYVTFSLDILHNDERIVFGGLS